MHRWYDGYEGEPLLLLHGITGSSADWAALMHHLAPWPAIALDARGHGESEWDPDEAYSGDAHFADVLTAVEALGLDRFALAGFSMGGTVAMMVAAALPERVSRLAVIDAYPDPRMTPGSRAIAGWVANYGANGWFDPAIARKFREQLAAGSDARLDLWGMWEAVQCPVLLVRGARSDVLPEPMAVKMLERQPRSRLVTIPETGHGIPFAAPGELAAALRHFLTA
jgi:pimeloyl-ACP methyl ester carboxylesterase